MSEFRRGWPVVLGAACGVGLGISGLLTYNSGLFVEGLAGEIGLSRTEYGAAFFGATVALALAMPAVSRAVEKFGPRATAAVGAVALSLGFLALSAVQSVLGYVLVMLLMGLLAAGSAPVPFTRVVVGVFQRSRGLALGFTQVGIGLAAMLFPPLIGAQIAQRGWRHGFVVLAMFAALGLVPILFGLPRRQKQTAVAAQAQIVDFAGTPQSRLYSVQTAAFAAMALAFAGMLPHFVPMLGDAGMPIARAGALAGLIGASVIVTRVIVGWLADRVEPAWLGAASCLLCAAGCVVLAVGGLSLAPVGAIALGAAMGAEADLIGILTARNFPLPAYSRTYAVQYAAFTIAAGVSPLWVGYLADVTGGYRLPLFLCAAGLLLPIALFLRLPAIRAGQPSNILD
jgi:MFS family permease